MALSTTLPGEGLCLMHRFVDRLIGNGECVAGGLTYLAGLLDAKYLWFVKSRHKKTTRRWFRDTAYCFDCSILSHGTGVGFAPHSTNAEQFRIFFKKLICNLLLRKHLC